MSLARLSLRDLEYLLAVVEAGHFGRAAQKCAVSQPALSAQIRKLESTLGLQLLERTSRGARMAGNAEQVIGQAARVVAEARRLLELAGGASGELSGQLRLWAIATLGPYLFPHVLRPIRDRFPAVELVLGDGLTDRILDDLQRGEVDAALVSPPLPAEGLELRPLFFEPFVLVHPRQAPLPLERPITIEKLDAGTLLLLEEGHCLREQALSLCTGAAQNRRVAASVEMLRHLVAAGVGHSILPALAAADGLTFGDLLSYVPIDDPKAGRVVALAWRSSDPRGPHFEALAELLREHAPIKATPLGGAVPASRPAGSRAAVPVP